MKRHPRQPAAPKPTPALTAAAPGLSAEPLVRRVRLQLELAHEADRCIGAEREDNDVVGDELGVDGSVVSRYRSPRCKDSVGLVDAVLAFGRYPELTHRLLQFVGDRTGFDIVPHEGALPATIPLVQVVHRAAALTTAAVDGEADGVITDAEASRELDEWNELLRVAMPRRQQLLRILGRLPGERR